MSYCPRCGQKVDESMTFCPNCGYSLKAGPTQRSPAPPPYQYRRNEKQEKQEKGEKNEKTPGTRISGLLIAGILIVIFGLIAVTDNLFHWLPSGPLAGAFWLIAIGVIIVVVAVYFASRARKSFPKPA